MLGFSFGLIRKNLAVVLLNEKGEKSTSFMDKNRDVVVLIRAAKRARQGGIVRPSSPDPTPAERLGILMNVLRRRENRDLDWVSERTGCALDELVAFEAGLLDHPHMLEVFFAIAIALRVNTVEDLPVLSQFPSVS